MSNLLMSILALAIVSGQLIRIPIQSGTLTLIDIYVFIFCIYAFFKTRLKLVRPPFFLKIAFVFIIVSILSLVLTPLHLKESEFLISLSYIIRLFIYLLFSLLLFSNVFKNAKAKIPLVLLISGIAFAILGLIQFLSLPDLQFLSQYGWDPHYFRTVSTFLDPNFAGAFLVLAIILWYQKFAIAKKWYLLIFIILYLALLTTFSRSSYLMFLVSGSALSLLKESRKIFLSTIILFIILLLGFQIYSSAVAQPRGINREQSASFRVNTWEQGLTIFQKSPIFGIGFNAYRYAVAEYNLGNEQFIQSHGSSSNDSSLLFVAATTGAVGLIIYLFFLASLLKYSYPDNPVLIAGLAGLLIHSFFANSLFYPFIIIWILLAVDIKN